MNIKTVLYVFVISCILSCGEEKTENVDYAILSGTISNYPSKTLHLGEIINTYGFAKEITISSEGRFKDTIHIEHDGKYILGDNQRLYIDIYLKKGETLDLTIDAKQLNKTKRIGNLATENNYLSAKDSIIKDFKKLQQKQGDSFYLQEPEVFKNYIKDFENRLNTLIQNYPDMDSIFIKQETKNNHYHYLDYVTRLYPKNYRYLTKQSDFQFPEGFLDEGKEIDIDNAKDYRNSIPYYYIVSDKIQTVAWEKALQDSIPFYKAFTHELGQLKSENIKTDLLASYVGYELKAGNKNNEEIYKLLMNSTSNEKAQKEFTENYEKIKSIAKGSISPTFEYENYEGGKTKLADLKGKYVYIDVWATWCVPCIREFPALKKLEKDYHAKNIEFVSISIDSKIKHDAWKAMISAKELGGTQLFADNAFQSEFIKKYVITSIPRFILIDTEGKIINADAPRPSDPGLTKLFEELKI